MKKILKRLMFAFVGVLGVASLASCGDETPTHNYKWESDATKHRQVCTDEGCDDATPYEAHVWGEWEIITDSTLDSKGSKKHTCTVCSYVGNEVIPEKNPALGALTADWNAVYVQAPADWEEVYVHYFNNDDKKAISEDYTSVWPGKLMTSVNAEKHIWGYQVPKGVSGLVFNNGNGTQTIDIETSTERNLYVLGAEANGEGKFEFTYKAYTPASTDPELGKPEAVVIEKMTVYAQVPAEWTSVNIHFWGVENTEWPGTAMTKVEGSVENLYKYENFVVGSGLIINNKVGDEGVQTANLSILEGVDTFIVDAEGGVTYGKYENGTITPVEVGLPEVWFVGGPTNWKFEDEANKLVTDIQNKKATITVELAADAEFKVCDSSWGNEAEFSYDSVTAFVAADGGNIKVVTAGTYVLTVDFSGAKPVLTIAEKVAPVLYCVGSHVNWGDGFVDANKFTLGADGKTATLEVTFTADTQFKVCDSSWGNEAQFSYDGVTAFAAGDGSNIKVVTAGTYVLTVSNILINPTLTIAAKGASTPSEGDGNKVTAFTVTTDTLTAGDVTANTKWGDNDIITILATDEKNSEGSKFVNHFTVEANSKKIKDHTGAELSPANRLKSNGKGRQIEIDLTNYTGSAIVEVWCITASSSDFTRGFKVLNEAGTQVGDDHLCTDGKNAQGFPLTLECGQKYTIEVITNGINFYGISVKAAE